MKLRIFTKTNWYEPPRIRHQFARLMRSYDNDVIFYQKPRYFLSGNDEKTSEAICLKRSSSLIHHQLRILPSIAFINSVFERVSIKRTLSSSYDKDIVINFNYDYYFLRKVFPNNKIITIINDDFVAQARFGEGGYAQKALEKTCKMSDEVLCVSIPLCKQVEKWCKPHLFLPWAENDYDHPSDAIRSSVVLWAHINDRVDFNLLNTLARSRPDISFDLVGPISNNSKQIVADLVHNHENVSWFPSQELSDINFSKYFAAIIPYKSGRKDIEAVTASNKTFQLLSKGMPLIVSGMPYFIESDPIFKSANEEDFLNFLDYCKDNFKDIQSKIECFVFDNKKEVRYSQIESILGNDFR